MTRLFWVISLSFLFVLTCSFLILLVPQVRGLEVGVADGCYNTARRLHIQFHISGETHLMDRATLRTLSPTGSIEFPIDITSKNFSSDLVIPPDVNGLEISIGRIWPLLTLRKTLLLSAKQCQDVIHIGSLYGHLPSSMKLLIDPEAAPGQLLSITTSLSSSAKPIQLKMSMGPEKRDNGRSLRTFTNLFDIRQIKNISISGCPAVQIDFIAAMSPTWREKGRLIDLNVSNYSYKIAFLADILANADDFEAASHGFLNTVTILNGPVGGCGE